MVTFAGERMIGIHRLRLAPDIQGLCLYKGLIVLRTDLPKGSLLSLGTIQSLSEHHQGVVTLRERVTEISTRTRTVVTIVHLTIAELYHQVVLINHTETHDLSSHDRY